MKKVIFVFTLVLSCTAICISQEKLDDKIVLNKLIIEFEESILTKDSVRFKKIFLDEDVQFVGIMSKKTEMSIKKDYPEFEGISVSTCNKFITEICKAEKEQEEKFYDIIIDTDRSIGSISFDYCFNSGGKMIQWGHEKWNVVKIGNEWLITDVIYSIRFPDIEQFPYSEEEKK